MRKYVMMLFAFIVVIGSTPLQFNAKEKEKTAMKDEVVYVTFTADGTMNEIFVMNSFDIIKEGTYKDYGTYSDVKNVTNVADISSEKGKNVFTTEKGKFHYQGTLEDKVLPWEFSISYFLDGEKIEPTSLAGKDGHVKIKIKSRQNDKGEQIFFDHYVVQISATFDTEHVDNIKTAKGMISNSGEDKQVTFTVLPEEEEELTVEADVVDFTFKGFEINAVPSFFDIDEPDVSEMEGDMNRLQKAIRDINQGVYALRNGIGELHQGASDLEAGSAAYKAGMDELASEVKGASADLDAAFADLDGLMDDIGDIDFAEIEELLRDIEHLTEELKAVRKELKETNDAFQKQYKNLDEAINAIPATVISESALAELYETDIDSATVDVIIETYEAAQDVRLVYGEAEDSFIFIANSLDDLIDSIDFMIDMVDEVVPSLEGSTTITDIASNMDDLTRSYKDFHEGINALTNGVLALADAYGDIHTGIGGLKDGSKQLENGASDLYDGTSKLEKATEQLPDRLKEEIDELLAKYDKSDFEPISFVSSKNKKVETVQYVMKTATIKKQEEEGETKEKKEKSMWQKFLDLFTFKK